MTGEESTTDAIRRVSLERGGGGEVQLNYDPSNPHHRGARPWQAATTIKPPYHSNRRLWVWGSSPADALSRLHLTLITGVPR